MARNRSERDRGIARESESDRVVARHSEKEREGRVIDRSIPAGPPPAAEVPLPLIRPWRCGSAHFSAVRADVDADWSIYLICLGR